MREISEPANLAAMALRMRWIIREQQIKQVEFAKTLGISANYVYLLTSGRKKTISEPLARLIENTYGYSAQWVLTGQSPGKGQVALRDLQSETIRKVKRMNVNELQAVAAFIKALKKTGTED